MPIDTSEKPDGSSICAGEDDLLRSALDGATAHAIVARAPDGRVLSWNEGARRLYGFEAWQVIGQHRSALSYDAGDTGDSFFRRCEVVRATGTWQGALERSRTDGTRMLVAVTLTAHADGQGQVLSYTEVSRVPIDALEVSGERTTRALLAKMSHDVRTPLNGIIGFAELLHKGKLGPVPPLHQEYLGDILTCARDLQAILDRVFESTHHAGGLPREPVNARDPSEASS